MKPTYTLENVIEVLYELQDKNRTLRNDANRIAALVDRCILRLEIIKNETKAS